MENQNVLHTKGYYIHKFMDIISETLVTDFENQITHNHVYIFNDDWDINDKKRKQCALAINPINQDFIEFLNVVVQNINPNLLQSNWVILKSETGCKTQMAHSDYVPTTELTEVLSSGKTDDIPLLVLFALTNDTYIYLWEHSIEILNGTYTEKVFPTKVELKMGELLIFRSDIIHAGSDYDKPNIRMHCYLDSKKVTRDEDTTFIIKLDAPTLENIVCELTHS